MSDISTFFNTIITTPLGWVFDFIYNFVQNYGITLLIFTALVKLVLLPLSVKQQKSMVKMQQIQPLLADIQQKYKDDPQKQQAEMMKFYKENKVNPSGGCLPLLIQMPILVCLYQVISYPLTYMLRMNNSQSWAEVVKAGIDTAGKQASELQILAAKTNNLINFDLIKGFIDLSEKPSLSQPSWIWLIPILAALTTYLSSKVTTLQADKNKKKTEDAIDNKPKRVLNPEAKPEASADQAQQMSKSMTTIMPLFTLWIAFSYPASLGFYWIVSNVLSILQQLYLNHKYGEKYKEEVMEIAAEKERQKKEKRRLKQKRNK